MGRPSARKPVRLRGKLATAVVRKGTGSEHESWVLEREGRESVILTPLSSNPFEKPAAPAPLGAEIEAEGFLLDHELRYRSVRRV